MIHIAVEGRIRTTCRIHNDEIQILFLQFFETVPDVILGFGGKAHEHLAILVPPKLFKNVGCGLEFEREDRCFLFDLLRRDGFRAEIERRCRFDHDVGVCDVFEDGTAQEIASFDASATPASIVLVLDVSPSIFRGLAEMRGAAHSLAANLSPADEIAVVSFSAEAHLLLPFSTDRALLDRAIQSKNLAGVENSSESNIYESVFLAGRELFRGRTGRKAIVLLTDGQDSGLGLTWDASSAQPREGAAASRLAFDDVARELGADGIALFIVSTENRPRAMTLAWLAAHQTEMLVNKNSRRGDMPHYTLYLAELARRVGGQLYFLREIGNLSEIYRRIALTISAQYTLGYYPSAGASRPGWRSLRVELADNAWAPAGSKLTHRGSYYVSAFP